MTQIDHKIEEREGIIEEGDILFVEDRGLYFKLLAYVNSDKYALYDLADDVIVAPELNHIAHAINHMNKHYGKFKVINSNRVTITIE